jgi:hypothetical protein
VKTQTIDNWLTEDLNNFLEERFLHSTPHFYRETSIVGSNTFYSCDFTLEDPLISFLAFKLHKTLRKNLTFKRIYINVQHPNMGGTFHVDEDCQLTCLYMVTGSGDFQIKNEGKIQFKKNKLICFDSKKEHRGIAPKEGVRITLAFKTNIINS